MNDLRMSAYSVRGRRATFATVIALAYLLLAVFLVAPRVTENIAKDRHIRLSSDLEAFPGTTLSEGFDANLASLFHSRQKQTSGSLVIELRKPKSLQRLEISPQANLPSRLPSSITVYGREKDHDWIRLARFDVAADATTNARGFASYPLPETSPAFKAYRLDLGASRDEYLAFSELRLLSNDLGRIQALFLLGALLATACLWFTVATVRVDPAGSSWESFFVAGITSLVVCSAYLLADRWYNPDIEAIRRSVAPLLLEPYRANIQPEPKERHLYIGSLLLLPLVLLGTSWLATRIRASWILAGSGIAAAAATWTLLDSIAKAADPHGPSHVIITGILASHSWEFVYVGVPLLLAACLSKTRATRIASEAIAAAAGLFVLLVVSAIGIFSYDTYPGNMNHFGAVHYAWSQVVNGGTILADVGSQYGLFPHLIAPFFWVIEPTTFHYSVVFALITVAGFLALYAGARATMRSPVLIGLVIPCIVALNYLLPKTNVWDIYLQYWPIRTLFPCLLIALAAHYFRGGSTLSYHASHLVAAVAPIWNLDSGLVTYLAWVFTLLFVSGTSGGPRDAVRQAVRHLGLSFLYLAAVCAATALFLSARAGAWIDVSMLVGFQRIYYEGGFYMNPMPVAPHPWLLVLGIYGMGLLKGALDMARGVTDHRSRMSVLVALLGFGLFTYYQGRSFDVTLLACAWPATYLAFVLADSAVEAVSRDGITAGRAISLGALLCFVSMSMVETLAPTTIRTFKDAARRGVETVRTSGGETDTLAELTSFLARNTSAGERILLLGLHDQESELYLRTRTRSAVRSPGSASFIAQADQDRLVAFLREDTATKIFLAPGGLPAEVESAARSGRKVVAHLGERLVLLQP